ncbi:hypothetical protein DEH69_12435 [Streptomyces sp. PT12]|nr:hypothetical protein DEH69_12435 [Streptomyces sp. PT12]
MGRGGAGRGGAGPSGRGGPEGGPAPRPEGVGAGSASAEPRRGGGARLVASGLRAGTSAIGKGP